MEIIQGHLPGSADSPPATLLADIHQHWTYSTVQYSTVQTEHWTLLVVGECQLLS